MDQKTAAGARPAIDVKWQEITPGIALQWLADAEESCFVNRKIATSRVRKLADCIIRGSWNPYSGESIKFDNRGNLIDGQHRLHAIVYAGVAVDAMIVRGCDSNASLFLDTGKSRTLSDILRLRGYKNTHILASVISNIWRHENGMPRKDIVPDAEVAIKFLVPHEAKVLDAVRHARAAGQNFGSGMTGLIWYKYSPYDKDMIENVFMFLRKGIVTSPLPSNAPRLLWQRLNSTRSNAMLLPRVIKNAMIIKTFNLCVERRDIGVLKWKPKQEYPSFIVDIL